MKIQFTGTHYHGGNYRFTELGEYEVDEAKAMQLLADFPDQFKATESTQKNSKTSSDTLNLSKANREQLEAVAGDIGFTVTADMDTNAKLKAAIEAHQKEAN